MLRAGWVQLLMMMGKWTVNQTVLPPGLRGTFLSDERCDFMIVNLKWTPSHSGADIMGQQFLGNYYITAQQKQETYTIKEFFLSDVIRWGEDSQPAHSWQTKGSSELYNRHKCPRILISTHSWVVNSLL